MSGRWFVRLQPSPGTCHAPGRGGGQAVQWPTAHFRSPCNILLVYTTGGTMPRTAKLFRNGRSQAVRLPSEFRFEGSEVYIRRNPAGDVILSRRPESWESFFELAKGVPRSEEHTSEL